MKKLIVSVLCSIVFLLAGCATGTNGTPSVSPVVAQIAVSYATMKVIEKNPAYADRIAVIAASVRAVAGGDKVDTVALLDSYIRSQISWAKISPADTMVVNLLLQEVEDQLVQRIGSGQLTPDKLLVVSEVAGWIEQAAKASAVPAK